MQCKDLYTNLASDMFNVPCSQVTPEMRRVAKSRAFAHAYTFKQQASGGTYTARVSGVTCDDGKVEVRLDNVERVDTCGYAKLEALEAACLYQDAAKRADEYEKLLLKVFPLVSKKAGPLSAKDFEIRLLDLHTTKLAVNRALRDAGIEMDGPLRSRVRKLADRNNVMSAELFSLKQGLTRLVEVGQRAGLYWDDAETQRLLTVAPTKAVCHLISKLTGVRYAFRASVAKAEAEARERAKAAAKGTWQAATFAATIAGGVVGSVLTYLLV
ncbi:DNA-binding protein [Pseudomonas phage vB_PaeP_130_113]|uniref:DNA-binding protein n=1 Tax=Pseudomonas phage vB_PaeP_130_113 TaxID=2161784 RepID=A0A2R4P983_9CAUD|nr:DNA polymerase [Pseudomonas phage vB_PaeP_130_113]AVX47621.1 DNA-binding protein [Pseudomonas phage vB_PaeP_130_113]